MEELDIWRAANVLLDWYGGTARLIAAMRAEALLADGDVDAELFWRRILRVIEELQRAERGHGEKVN